MWKGRENLQGGKGGTAGVLYRELGVTDDDNEEKVVRIGGECQELSWQYPEHLTSTNSY